MGNEAAELKSIPVFAEIDQEVGIERYNKDQRAERLTRKLTMIMADEDLNVALGVYVRDLVLRGQVDQRKMTEAQADRVRRVIRETIHGMMSPADLAVIERETRGRPAKELYKESPFARW